MSPVIFGHKVFAIHFRCWVLHSFDLTETSGCFFIILFCIREWFLVFIQSICTSSAVVNMEQWHCGFPCHLSCADSCRVWHPPGFPVGVCPWWDAALWAQPFSHISVSRKTHPPCVCSNPVLWTMGWAGRTWERFVEEKQPENPSPKGYVWINFLPCRQRNKLVRFYVEGSFDFKNSQVLRYSVLQRKSTSPQIHPPVVHWSLDKRSPRSCAFEGDYTHQCVL